MNDIDRPAPEPIVGGQRNPVLPLEHHIPDGEARVMPDGRLYVYGSYDVFDDWYCSDRYHVASTGDLRDWTVHDTALRGEDVPWFPDPSGYDATVPPSAVLDAHPDAPPVPPWVSTTPLLYAPDAIHHDGVYYLYFCMADGSEGVATSAHPAGPFEKPTKLPCSGIDPAIFIDDDCAAYYYWGQIRAKGVRLGADLTSFAGEVVDGLVTEEHHGFHEGASMRKIGDTYYLVYSDASRGKPTALGYATAPSPLGPFEYRGTIVDNAESDPESWNNHGSIASMNGRWYVFYHRSTRGSRFHRRLCIEPIQILDDGSIPEVLMTSQGVGEPFGAGEYLDAFRACALRGAARIDLDGKGLEHLVGFRDGAEVTFRYVRSDTGFASIELDAQGAAQIDVLLGDHEVGRVRVDGERRSYRADLTTGTIDDQTVRMTLRLRVRQPRLLSIWGFTLGR